MSGPVVRWTAVPDAVLFDLNLKGSAFSVYTHLIVCGGGGPVSVTKKGIAKALHMAIGTVDTALLDLEDCKHIAVSRRRGSITYTPLSGGYRGEGPVPDSLF